MGAGASSQTGSDVGSLDHSPEKWKGLIGELEAICKEQQADLAKQTLQEGLGGPTGRKRGSSILKKESSFTDRKNSGELLRTRSGSVVIKENNQIITPGAGTKAKSAAVRPLEAMQDPCALDEPPCRSPLSATFSDDGRGGSSVRKPRSLTMKLKKHRKEFYDQYITDDEINPAKELQCRYIGLMCAAMSFLLEAKGKFETNVKRITVEDIFFETHLPLHYLDKGNVSLSNLRDISQEFINHDPRCKGIMKVQAVHMESSLAEGEVEPGHSANESGDRGPMPLAAFRKSMEEEFKEMKSCKIFSYDPFVVEQDMLRVDDSDSDSDGAEGEVGAFNGTLTIEQHSVPEQSLDAMQRYKSAPDSRFGMKNDGWFSLASDFNTATNTVTLCDAVLDQDIHMTEQKTPLNALYRGCCTKDNYTSRFRGFLEFSLVDEEDEDDSPKELYPSDLYTGHGPNGIPLISVRPTISSHLVALALGIHLIQGFETQESGNGIDVRSLCNELDFPLSVVTGYEMQLLEVFAYYDHYLKETLLANIWASAHPIDKKVESADSPPNISIMALHEILIKATSETPELDKVMILQFDLACAHNVLNIAPTGTSHFGILQAYDPEKQHIEILDVEPAKYGRQWSTTLQRLHKAMIGKGYIFLYKSQEVSNFEDDRGLMDNIQATLTVKRHDTLTNKRLKNLRMKPTIPAEFIKFFEYPTTVTPITQIAVALNILNPSRVTLPKDVMHKIETDPSFLVDPRISMNDVTRICVNYILNSQQQHELTAECVNFDTCLKDERKVSLQVFEDVLRKAVASRGSPTEVLIINCAPKTLEACGGRGGEYLILLDVDDNEGPSGPIVSALDAHKCLYTRFLKIPLSDLYNGCIEHDPLCGRARGYIKLSTGELPEKYRCGRDLSLFSVPQWEQFRVPQCTHLNGTALALTTLGHTCSVEEMFYTAYTCLGGERFRRGSSIFPWHTMKINMSELSERMSVTAVAKMVLKFEQASQHCLTAAIVIGSSKEDFQLLLEEASEESCKFLVCVIVNTEEIFDIKLTDAEVKWKLGCGIIKDYDAEKRIVHIVDANPTRYGEVWSVDVDVLYRAADLDSSDKGENGIIKIGKTQTGTGAKRKSVVEAEFRVVE